MARVRHLPFIHSNHFSRIKSFHEIIFISSRLNSHHGWSHSSISIHSKIPTSDGHLFNWTERTSSVWLQKSVFSDEFCSFLHSIIRIFRVQSKLVQRLCRQFLFIHHIAGNYFVLHCSNAANHQLWFVDQKIRGIHWAKWVKCVPSPKNVLSLAEVWWNVGSSLFESFKSINEIRNFDDSLITFPLCFALYFPFE